MASMACFAFRIPPLLAAWLGAGRSFAAFGVMISVATARIATDPQGVTGSRPKRRDGQGDSSLPGEHVRIDARVDGEWIRAPTRWISPATSMATLIASRKPCAISGRGGMESPRRANNLPHRHGRTSTSHALERDGQSELPA